MASGPHDIGHGAGHEVVLAIDLNPLDWLGGAVAGAAADGWKAAMIGLWSAGLWLLQLSFKIIDAFTTPDVSGSGPLKPVLPTTLWLGLFVVTLMMLLQLAVALIRRDGQSLGRIFVGMLQFGLVWLSYLVVAGALIVAAGGLTKGILASLLHIDSWSAFSTSSSWPRSINDATAATILGIASILLLIPASFGYLLIMLVREAALVILIATAPITAAGLVNDTSKVWFWKSLRWFIASLLIAPAAALILGVGVSLSRGVVAGAGTSTVAAAGAAVVGCVLVAIGAVCPMVLFKLLAFIEPGTGSGAALRQSMTDAGGVSGLLRGKSSGATGSSAATQDDGTGRAAGEAAAETQTSSRVASVLGPAGAGIGAAMSMATRAADLASDVLGSAGVGDPGYSRTFADNNTGSRPPRGGGRSAGSGQQSDGEPPPEPQPPTPPPRRLRPLRRLVRPDQPAAPATQGHSQLAVLAVAAPVRVRVWRGRRCWSYEHPCQYCGPLRRLEQRPARLVPGTVRRRSRDAAVRRPADAAGGRDPPLVAGRRLAPGLGRVRGGDVRAGPGPTRTALAHRRHPLDARARAGVGGLAIGRCHRRRPGSRRGGSARGAGGNPDP